MLSSIQKDKLITICEDGGLVLQFSEQFYCTDAVLAAIYKFTDRCVARLDPSSDGYIYVRLWPKEADRASELESIAAEITNEVLDQQVRVQLNHQFGHLRDAIVDHAFAPIISRDSVKKNTVDTSSYDILPFTFRRLPSQEVLLVNQGGEFITLSASDFERMIHGNMEKNSAVANNLRGKHFIACDNGTDVAVQLIGTKLRTRKGFLRWFTTLHMVVVTAYCNFNCDYCHASSVSPESGSLNMSKDTARAVVDTVFQTPSPSVKIEFQGGEPLLNWEVVRYIVEYAEQVNLMERRNLEFVICTNLTLLNEDLIHYFQEHNMKVSTSLDGPQGLHDLHRIRLDGSSGYEAFQTKLALLQEISGDHCCSALVTVTNDHLGRLRDVVDEYVHLGFRSVFLRPVNPYGLATAHWNTIGYPIEDFVESYKDALGYIIHLNQQGTRFIEYYSTLLLTRILTPFSTGFVDLQSPSGAGISGVIYDYDGSIYPADEGRMLARTGDTRFRLGSVHEDQYEDVFGGEKLHELTANSCVETLPGCAWCAYQLYCGSDPIRNYVESGDTVGHRPTSDFCRKNMAIIDHLFSLLRDDKPEVTDVFWSWITDRDLETFRK